MVQDQRWMRPGDGEPRRRWFRVKSIRPSASSMDGRHQRWPVGAVGIGVPRRRDYMSECSLI